MKIVVIGGVAAGPRAAARAKRLLPDAEVILINDSKELSYGACGLPYFASGDINDIYELFKTSYGIVRDEQYFVDVKGLEVIAPYRAVKIDRDNKTVTAKNIENGEETRINYDKLVIATGASPYKLNLRGADSEKITTFSRPGDARKLRKMAEMGQLGSGIIIGAGFIGCELCESFGALWGIEATVLEAENHVLPRMLDEEMASIVHAELVRNGVKVHCGCKVERFEDTEGGIAVIAGGERFEADTAVVAVGFKPNSELAVDAGLQVGKTGGIITNSRMQTSDENIYAGGDCVESFNLVTGKPCYLPLGSIANRHGRLIGNNLAGRTGEFSGVVGAIIVKVFDMNIAAAGLTETQARGLGIDVGCAWTAMPDKAEYYPEWKYIYLKLVFEKGTGRLLGLQAVGPGDVARRVDVFSGLLQKKGTVDDLFDIEHAYSPPYSPALDPLYVMGCIAKNTLDDDLEAINPMSLLADDGNSFSGTILDVREDEERESDPIKASGANIIEIPLDKIRDKLNDISLNGNATILCHRGVRGYEAARIIKNAGLGNVTFVGGGKSFMNALKAGE
ncbi:MAG: pyridine nucleotide-disulfide oxidoreductase [candidate division Zixibacteria bacterium]|nr:pyridine nucleotide-disulfide oxidoreductase [candidate division Zixibacteria bacterium]